MAIVWVCIESNPPCCRILVSQDHSRMTIFTINRMVGWSCVHGHVYQCIQDQHFTLLYCWIHSFTVSFLSNNRKFTAENTTLECNNFHPSISLIFFDVQGSCWCYKLVLLCFWANWFLLRFILMQCNLQWFKWQANMELSLTAFIFCKLSLLPDLKQFQKWSKRNQLNTCKLLTFCMRRETAILWWAHHSRASLLFFCCNTLFITAGCPYPVQLIANW